MNGFGRVDLERADGVDVFFRPCTSRRLLNSRKDEVRSRPVEVDESSSGPNASIN